MNNSGSAEDVPLVNESMKDQVGEAPPEHRRPPIGILLLLAFGVVLGVYVGTNVIGVLYGIVSPPLPPVPDGLTEAAHTSDAYGADVWTYTADRDPCDYAGIYQNLGTCVYAPLQCGQMREVPGSSAGALSAVARCSGGQKFSIFNMKWWALIERNNDDGSTKIELEREVFWIGTGPS